MIRFLSNIISISKENSLETKLLLTASIYFVLNKKNRFLIRSPSHLLILEYHMLNCFSDPRSVLWLHCENRWGTSCNSNAILFKWLRMADPVSWRKDLLIVRTRAYGTKHPTVSHHCTLIAGLYSMVNTDVLFCCKHRLCDCLELHMITYRIVQSGWSVVRWVSGALQKRRDIVQTMVCK